MITNVTTLFCPTPSGQPLSKEEIVAHSRKLLPGDSYTVVPKKSISAASTSVCRNGGRGFAQKRDMVENARRHLGKPHARAGRDFVVLADTPEPGRWSWAMLATPKVDRRADGLIVGSVDARLVDLALRPQGVTRGEMREALGWKSDPWNALMAACNKARMQLSTVKHGTGPFRYRGRYL